MKNKFFEPIEPNKGNIIRILHIPTNQYQSFFRGFTRETRETKRMNKIKNIFQ